jgi:hypothetical protein
LVTSRHGLATAKRDQIGKQVMAKVEPPTIVAAHRSNMFARPAWTGWIAGASCQEDLRAALVGLRARLVLSREQLPLFDLFIEKMVGSFTVSDAPDPGDGWDMGKSAALDRLLRLEIAAGRFLGAIEETRESFARLYAVLDTRQRRIADTALMSEGR